MPLCFKRSLIACFSISNPGIASAPALPIIALTLPGAFVLPVFLVRRSLPSLFKPSFVLISDTVNLFDSALEFKCFAMVDAGILDLLYSPFGSI